MVDTPSRQPIRKTYNLVSAHTPRGNSQAPLIEDDTANQEGVLDPDEKQAGGEVGGIYVN